MILIGYTHKPGRVDRDSIESFKKKKDVEKVVIFCREAPSKEVEDLFEDYEIVVTKNPRKDAKRFGKELKGKDVEVLVVDLQDFGERAMRDVC